ncbi:PstS family phosphate ABC transporter substrate-binding protein [Puniceicoccus vermicola]|uniref:Substrate-binding domain-containing protein n=1 Tax=Puniceicoccus vermicola TaxID=388746 RepID=A0A7X1E616_9BACT|nr:substrate-binding domain-containing protein [Puniceicoccus vermicola]MBC2602182.1 substrate-binding domain-containing protein [Puniceicoccus vermicola]
MKGILPQILLLTLALSSVLQARVVRIEGSDYIPPALVEALEAFASEEGDQLEIQLGGSLLAFRDFYEGEADLILVAMPHQDPTELDFPVLPFAFQIGAVVVNRKNPLKSLTRQQIGGIYGSLTENAIARWSDLGLSGAWQNRNIQAAYANPGTSPVLDLFSARFLDREPIRSGIQEYDSSIQLESFVSNNDGAIGVIDTLPLSTELKALRIEAEDGGVSFGPTLENVNYGDYPLALAYYVCVPRSQYRFLAPYLEFLLSDSVAEILQSEGFFPILNSRRRQLAADLPIAE